MATTSTSRAAAVVESVFTEPERLALAGFLAGYTCLTRVAYALGLRQYASWCQQCHIRLFQACRADIECFARDMEARSRAWAATSRRLCTIAGFCKYAVKGELLERSLAAHVRLLGNAKARTSPPYLYRPTMQVVCASQRGLDICTLVEVGGQAGGRRTGGSLWGGVKD